MNKALVVSVIFIILFAFILSICGFILIWQGYWQHDIYKLITGGIILIYGAINNGSLNRSKE